MDLKAKWNPKIKPEVAYSKKGLLAKALAI